MSESHWFKARRTPQVFYFEQDGPNGRAMSSPVKNSEAIELWP